MLLPDAGCKLGVPCRDLLPAGPWAGAAPSPSLGPQPSPAGVPGRPRPQCLSQPLVHCLQGIKKPYNPILGETFRCCWFHPQTNSHTFYIAEQARATLVGGHWWRVGSVSAQACFWAAPPWTVGRALASLPPGGFSQGVQTPPWL